MPKKSASIVSAVQSAILKDTSFFGDSPGTNQVVIPKSGNFSGLNDAGKSMQMFNGLVQNFGLAMSDMPTEEEALSAKSLSQESGKAAKNAAAIAKFGGQHAENLVEIMTQKGNLAKVLATSDVSINKQKAGIAKAIARGAMQNQLTQNDLKIALAKYGIEFGLAANNQGLGFNQSKQELRTNYEEMAKAIVEKSRSKISGIMQTSRERIALIIHGKKVESE